MHAPRCPAPAAAAHASAAPRVRRKPLCTSLPATLLLALVASRAYAQFSGTVSLLSDYRYRGVSLTDDQPAAQLGVVYDDPRNWYVGAVATTAITHCAGACAGVQAVSYAGYAWRQPSGVTLDAGLDVWFSTASQRYSFAEMYAGFTYVNTSGRVYYAPRYFGQDTPSVYVEVTQTLPVHDRVRLLGHVGLLHVGNTGPYPYGPSNATDVLLGAAVDVAPVELRLTWQHVTSLPYPYPVAIGDRRSRFVVQVSYGF
ncbi:MAG TPA: TorF family putative porin [Casimicrobiaceae bacterium]